MGNCLSTKFGILAQQYTNDLTNHGIVLQACAVLIQLSIELGSTCLFNNELNNTQPSEADLEDVINNWMTTTWTNEKRMFHFELFFDFLGYPPT